MKGLRISTTRHDRRLGDQWPRTEPDCRDPSDCGRRRARRSHRPAARTDEPPALPLYPLVPQYDGSGDKAEAASFSCVTPS